MAVKSKQPNRNGKSHQLFLGVDGGGTKTHIALMNSGGKVKSEGFAGPSNPLRVGVETAVDNIVKAITEATDTGGLSRGDIVAATIGLAGVRRADLRLRVRESFFKRIGVKDALVITDAEIALYATTLGKSGLVVIAGTGSVFFGKNDEGEIAISGGWGPLAGDEGGGRGIAGEALHAIAKASDGRGPMTQLSERAAVYFRASNVDNLIGAIYAPNMDNSRIAGFAKFVVETAAEGDNIAIEIINAAGRELGTAAVAVIEKLELEKAQFPIGCVGSVFNAGELLTGPMNDLILATAPNASLAKPKIPPAHAAALMAMRNGVK